MFSLVSGRRVGAVLRSEWVEGWIERCGLASCCRSPVMMERSGGYDEDVARLLRLWRYPP